MSGQHPSKSASARCLLARGCAAGRGTAAARAFVPLGMGGGRELAKCFPSRGAGDLIASAPWERLSGVFLVVSVFCFSFPAVFFQLGNVALLRFSRRAWKAAVCLSVCEGGRRARAVLNGSGGCGGRQELGDGDEGDGCPLQK